MDEEQYLLEIIRELQLAHEKQLKPYIDRLVAIRNTQHSFMVDRTGYAAMLLATEKLSKPLEP